MFYKVQISLFILSCFSCSPLGGGVYNMTRKERYAFAIDWFEKNMPVAETELEYEDPYELIVAVILSAQCTDKRVNMTTPAIFKKYPTVQSLSNATFDELFPFIKSISYPNNKQNT